MEIFIIPNDDLQWELLKKWFDKNLSKEFPNCSISEEKEDLYINLEHEDFKQSLTREEKEGLFEKLIFDNLKKIWKKLQSN